MREIQANAITASVAALCVKACTELPDDVKERIYTARKEETWQTAQDILNVIIENFESNGPIPLCQDTGMACVFLEIGQDVHITNGNLCDAVHAGVAKGYTEGLLRKSVVGDPLERVNTGDNTPAAITVHLVAGEGCRITVAPKGFGSENMSRLKMFTPSATKEDIIDFVTETVNIAGSNPCPPIVVGVGIGGDFEQVAYLSKKALCRNLDKRNADEFYADMEAKMLEKINLTGIGSQGFGGTVTALYVNIETAPTHIAGLPVAVNIGCHVTRHKEAVI